MKRRTFVKSTLPLIALPGLVKGIPMAAINGLTDTNIPATGNKILVMIELNGGNDGLNTIIPLNQYKNLLSARKNILIPEKKILPLPDTNIAGLHPSLKPLLELYNQKQMAIIQGIGYPHFSFSHFRATDIIKTGAGADNSDISTGFLGRFLSKQYNQYPKGFPNTQYPDPLALTVGPVPVSTILQGNNMGMGLSISSSSSFYNLISGVNMDAPISNTGRELNFMRQMSTLTNQYDSAMQNAGKKQKTLSSRYPKKNDLAENLKVIAQLIGGGLQTSIYITTLFNFDHHNSQVDSDDSTKGKHAELLAQLSSAVTAFMDDLQLMGVEDRVVCLIHSEFGRRIKSNASYGTDHGSAQPFILLGSQLKGGIIGKNPVIPENVTVADNLEMQYDYRSVYTTILKKWLKATDEEVTSSVLGSFPELDLFK